MKTISTIQNYEQFGFNSTIVPRAPESGFSFAFGSTGSSSGVFSTGMRFYGSGGLVFDDDNIFFGGYRSGQALNIDGYFFGDRMSYFSNDVLVRNNKMIANDFDCIEFDKHGDSELVLQLNYVSGLR